MTGNIHSKKEPRQYILECDHEFRTREAPPKTRDEVFCQTCRKYRQVVSVRGEYWWRCTDCQAGKSSGRSSFNCKRAARAHVAKVHHTVEVFDSQHLIDVFRWDHPMLGVVHESFREPLLMRRKDPQREFRESIARANEQARLSGNAEVDAYITRRRAKGDAGSHVRLSSRTVDLDADNR